MVKDEINNDDPYRAAAESRPALDTTQERLVLLALAAAQFTNIVDFMVVMPLGPQLMRRLAIDPAEFGFVVSAYTFAAGVAGLLASAVIDRVARKTAFMTLYVGFMLGTLLCGLAPSYPALVAARVVTGAFGGVLGGLSMAMIGDVFPEERRGRATGALMSAFAVATVFGVPVGLELGVRWGWHAPFLALAALGSPVLLLAAWAMPTLRPCPREADGPGPLATMLETLTRPNHWKAFSLIITLMFGSFAVIPYVSTYLVKNAGVLETDLKWVFVAGGVCTLFTAPLAGRLADHFGRQWVYRIVAPASAALMLVVTQLPRVGLGIAAAIVASLMVANSSRMVAAMALVNDSVEQRRRGGFMTANSSLQHLASGLGAFVGGQILTETNGSLHNYGLVGLIGATATLASIWLASRVRSIGPGHPITTAESMSAAAEATVDAGELGCP